MVCHTLGLHGGLRVQTGALGFSQGFALRARETHSELKDLHARRIELERALRVHYPSLRVSDSLFQEFQSYDFNGLDHENLTKKSSPALACCKSGCSARRSSTR